jgi:hypothetical protein
VLSLICFRLRGNHDEVICSPIVICPGFPGGMAPFLLNQLCDWRNLIWLIKSLNLAGLFEHFAVNSWIFQPLLVPTTICTSQLQLCQNLLLAATSSVCCKDLTMITTLWNIVLQNESNRNLKQTTYRKRTDCAGG